MVKTTKIPNQTTPNTTTQLSTCTLQGRKSYTSQWTNQDTFLAKQLSDGITLLAVIDGHGEHGHIIARHVRDFFLQNAKAASEKPESSLKHLFKILQDRLQKGNLMRESQFSGCTATVAVVDTLKETMTLAYVGDSRLCLLDSKGKPVFETVDHIVSGEDERHILATGVADVREETACGVTARRVFRKGTSYPGLAMSRSLGDCVAHALGVQAEPTVVTMPFIAEQTIVVASDGVWEHMTAEEVAAIICKDDKSVAAAAARNVVYAARQRWIGAPNPLDVDDITSVVFRNSGDLTSPLSDSGDSTSCASAPRCASPSRNRAKTV
jgi:serine/threonine protein phosphatase PrpC